MDGIERNAVANGFGIKIERVDQAVKKSLADRRRSFCAANADGVERIIIAAVRRAGARVRAGVEFETEIRAAIIRGAQNGEALLIEVVREIDQLAVERGAAEVERDIAVFVSVSISGAPVRPRLLAAFAHGLDGERKHTLDAVYKSAVDDAARRCLGCGNVARDEVRAVEQAL